MPVVHLRWDDHRMVRGKKWPFRFQQKLALILVEEFGLEPNTVRVYNYQCNSSDFQDITLRPLSIDIDISARRLGQTEFNLKVKKVVERVRELLPETMVGNGRASIWFKPVGGNGEVVNGVFESL